MSERIVTARLVLEPLTRETVNAVLDGRPDGLVRGEGWPHADTLAGLGMWRGRELGGWLITLDGAVVGDRHLRTARRAWRRGDRLWPRRAGSRPRACARIRARARAAP